MKMNVDVHFFFFSPSMTDRRLLTPWGLAHVCLTAKSAVNMHERHRRNVCTATSCILVNLWKRPPGFRKTNTTKIVNLMERKCSKPSPKIWKSTKNEKNRSFWCVLFPYHTLWTHLPTHLLKHFLAPVTVSLSKNAGSLMLTYSWNSTDRLMEISFIQPGAQTQPSFPCRMYRLVKCLLVSLCKMYSAMFSGHYKAKCIVSYGAWQKYWDGILLIVFFPRPRQYCTATCPNTFVQALTLWLPQGGWLTGQKGSC